MTRFVTLLRAATRWLLAGRKNREGESGWSWTAPVNVLVIIGIVIGIIGLGPAFESADLERRQAETVEEQIQLDEEEASRRSGLTVEAVKLYTSDRVHGEVSDAVHETVTEVDDLPGATIDVLLANRAPGPALITDITVRAIHSEYLPACGAGGGPTSVSQNYNFEIPTPLRGGPATVAYNGAWTPFEVGANETDRLTLTLGHDYDSEHIPLWYAVVDISFTVSDAALIDLGRFVLFSRGDAQVIWPEPETQSWQLALNRSVSDPKCHADLYHALQTFIDLPGAHVQEEWLWLEQSLADAGFDSVPDPTVGEPDGGTYRPWELGTSEKLAADSCWHVSVDDIRPNAATLSIACDQAGSPEYGTPTPGDWLVVSAITPTGERILVSKSHDVCSGGTFCSVGPMDAVDPVTSTLALPGDEEVWGITVTDRNGDGGTWRGLSNRGRLPIDRNE